MKDVLDGIACAGIACAWACAVLWGLSSRPRCATHSRSGSIGSCRSHNRLACMRVDYRLVAEAFRMSSPDQYRAARQTPQSAASILARHGAAQRALTAKQLRDGMTNELRQCIDSGQVANLGWRS